MSKKLTIEEFIEKARKVHGDKFDYSKVVFINSYTKVIIICPVHGEFLQIPNDHLRGSSCSKCFFEKNKLTIEEFIEKARKVHGDKFDYSKVVIINACTKVIIICPIHGEFLQFPIDHLRGSSCSKCKIDKYKQYFLIKAKKIHGDKFDYSKVVFINACTKVIIICPIHGEFLQTPNSHLSRCGCPICGIDSRKLTIEEFIEKARKVHGDKFDYSKVVFINRFVKVIIICPIHREFLQTPEIHLKESGCPRCNRSKGEIAISDILEKHNIEFQEEYKIPEVGHNFEYDFHLPDHKLLIEFHGKQHYESIPFFGGEDNLNYTKRNDEIKKYHAYKFKYRYLEFNYKHLKLLSKEQFEELVLKTINYKIKK